MNQGELDVVKQEMARVNMDILGISELKWTGMGEFNSDDHCTCYCRRGSLGRNGAALIVNQRVQNASTKSSAWVKCRNDRMITVHLHCKPFSIRVIQVNAPNTDAKEDEVDQFYEDQQNLLELIPIKDVLYITGDWNVKVGSQEILGATGKFGLGVKNEGGQRLTKFCQENTLVIAITLFL